MCGIAGFNFRDGDALRRMNAVQGHRGPDGEGVYEDEWVSLGHRRLSIIDLSERAAQPMRTADGGLVLTYNGEVYNFRELRTELEAEGESFRTTSDTEVVLAAYRRWGRHALARLNGMFAFAVYDRRARELFLARDRVGIKPLYYYYDGRRFVFASEIKALLEHGIPRELNERAVAQFFTFRFNYGRETVFRNVYKLPPGHLLRFDLEKGRIAEETAWWELDPFGEIAGDEDELAAELRRLVADAVSLRLVADVPLGFFLSGGIDSSIVTGVAARAGARLETFSAGFETTNELPYASLASRHFGSEHHEIRMGDEALDLLDEMVYHMDEPIGDAAFLATLILSREARRHVKVVLAGEGADELFTGYDRYKLARYGDALSALVPGLARDRLRALRAGGENLRRLARILAAPSRGARYLEIVRLFSADELEELAVTAQGLDGIPVPEEGDLLKAVQYFDVKTVLPNDFFMKADKMSSAWGLEERVPFLDDRLVELAFALPSRLKLGLWNEKRILKRAFRDLLPPEIVRRRKHGFNVPMDHWLKGPLYHRLKALLEEERHGLYRKEPVLELLERFRSAGESYKANFYDAQKLWSVLTFELWLRKFVG